MNISIGALRRSPWAIALLIWAFVFTVSSIVGGVFFFPFSPRTVSALLLGNLFACMVAWMCLWFDEDANRRMASVLGFGMIFFGWGLLFVQEPLNEIFNPWLDSTLIILAGGLFAWDSPREIAEDLVG
jgi:hypothetical protein